MCYVYVLIRSMLIIHHGGLLNNYIFTENYRYTYTECYACYFVIRQTLLKF